MRRPTARHGTRAIWMLLWASLLLCAGVAGAVDDVPDVDPAGISDPVERKFYQELRELRHRQKLQRQELASREMDPEARLERRRELLVQEHKQLQELEAAYQAKLSPEARTRWMERKANREKRFEKLQQGEPPPRKRGKGKSTPKSAP